MSIVVEPRLLQAEGDLSSDEIMAIQTYITDGEYEPALIVDDGEEAMAAVACQKADAVIHVRFSPQMTKFLKDNYQITLGSRLVSINSYSESMPAHPDLAMYGRDAGRYKQVHPIIAETVAASPEELHTIRESLAADYAVLQERYRDDETRYIRRSLAMHSHKVVDLWDSAQDLQLDGNAEEELAETPQWQTSSALNSDQGQRHMLDPWLAYPLAVVSYVAGGAAGFFLTRYIEEHGAYYFTAEQVQPIINIIGFGPSSLCAAFVCMFFANKQRRRAMMIMSLSFCFLATTVIVVRAYVMIGDAIAVMGFGYLEMFFVLLMQCVVGWLLASCCMAFVGLFSRSR